MTRLSELPFARHFALGLLALSLLIAAALVLNTHSDASALSSGSSALGLAKDLASSPPISASDEGATDTSARLNEVSSASVAAQIERSVPLPPGGSFRDIDWAQVGGTSAAGVRSFIEYNASCDWYRYAVNSSGDASTMKGAIAVLATIPAWPSFKASPESAAIAERIASAASQNDLVPAQQQISLNCGP